MPVNSANVTSNLGTPPNPYSSTPTIVGIVVPIGVMLVVGFAYYICSRGNMDMPGAYVDISSTARDTELKALWSKVWWSEYPIYSYIINKKSCLSNSLFAIQC